MNPFKLEANQHVNKSAQQNLDILSAGQANHILGTFNEAVANTDVNNGAPPNLADFGGLQFPVNNIPANNLPTGTFGTPNIQNETLSGTMPDNLPTGSPQPPLMPNGPLGTLQGTMANSFQVAPIATPNEQQNGPLGTSPEISPDLIALILGAKNIHALLPSYASAPGLSGPSLLPATQRPIGLGSTFSSLLGSTLPGSLSTAPPSLGSSGSSSLTNSTNPSPSAMANHSNAPSVNGLWNNMPTNWLMDPAYSSMLPGILSPTPSAMTTPSSSSLMSSTNVSPALPGHLPIASSFNDSIQNGYFPWNNSQSGLMNFNSSLNVSMDFNATGLGTFLRPETPLEEILPIIKKPRGRKKQDPVRNAVDRYSRARKTALKNRGNVTPITVGTEEYDKKLDEAKKHYLDSDVNKDKYLKTILHFFNQNLIDPFSDPQEDFPRNKCLQTPTPRKMYAEWIKCTGRIGKTFNELEDENSEEYKMWRELAIMVQDEVCEQIKKGFITGVIPKRRNTA